MKIVVLDGYTLNPGDLSWDELKSLGECTIYDRTRPDQVVERAENAEIVLLNKTPLSDDAISRLLKLKYIGVLATGYNIVDVKAAGERDIPVTNVPTYGTKSVAQMVFALILELTQNVGRHSKAVHDGRWTRSKDWCFWDRPLVELDGLTMGIIGFGRIGRMAGSIATGFGMQVIAHDPLKPSSIPDWISMVELDTVFKQSDIVSLHCPLTPENNQFINAEKLRLMKKKTFLINTSRGPLINEQDLAVALNKEIIAGAGLDVLSIEPPPDDNPLLKAKNCLITPHISWATKAARMRLMKVAVDNLKAFLDGNPVNVISKNI